jgi:hypothetical protein
LRTAPALYTLYLVYLYQVPGDQHMHSKKEDLIKALAGLGLTVKEDKIKKADVKKVLAESWEERKKALDQALEAEGVTEVYMTYSGSGDSGDIDTLNFKGATPPDDLHAKVETFLWDFLESVEAGWEINDGGEGEISWEVGTTLTVEHKTFYMQTDETTYKID